MTAEKLADIIKSGKELSPQDFGFIDTNRRSGHYSKSPFELKSIHNGWNLIKWVTENDKLSCKILLRGIYLDTNGLLKLQKHLRNEKLDELLGLIS